MDFESHGFSGDANINATLFYDPNRFSTLKQLFFVFRSDNKDCYVSTETLRRLSRCVSELKASGEFHFSDTTKLTIFIDTVMANVDAAKKLSIAPVSESSCEFHLQDCDY